VVADHALERQTGEAMNAFRTSTSIKMSRPVSLRPPFDAPLLPGERDRLHEFPLDVAVAEGVAVEFSFSHIDYSWSSSPKGLRKGDDGQAVAALQLNLRNVDVDGAFGPLTEQSVMDWQKGNGLVVDGIAGYVTQRSIVVRRSQPSSLAHGLPTGFLKSKAAQESSFCLASCGPHPSDWGFDLGAYALSIGPNTMSDTQDSFLLGFDAGRMADRAGSSARTYYNDRSDDKFVLNPNWYGEELAVGSYRPVVFGWQLTALDWNWPYAAKNLATIGSVYIDPARDDQPQSWIISASGGRLSTPRQWVLDYTTRATASVDWSTV
jgi:hypothetical protein